MHEISKPFAKGVCSLTPWSSSPTFCR